MEMESRPPAEEQSSRRRRNDKNKKLVLSPSNATNLPPAWRELVKKTEASQKLGEEQEAKLLQNQKRIRVHVDRAALPPHLQTRKELMKEARRFSGTRTVHMSPESCVMAIAEVTHKMWLLRASFCKKNKMFNRNLSGVVKRLMQHPRRQDINSKKASGGWDIRWCAPDKPTEIVSRWFPGITGVLHKAFYPDDEEGSPDQENDVYRNDVDRSDPSKSKNRKTYEQLRKNLNQQAKRSAKDDKNNFVRCPQAAGCEHGAAVHHQIDMFVTHCIMGQNRKSIMQWNEKDLQVRAEAFMRHIVGYRFFDFCCLRLINQLIEMRLIPVSSEYMLYNNQLCIGSSIDLICVDSEGRPVPIEVKTGYESEFYVPIEPMLRRIIDSKSPLSRLLNAEDGAGTSSSLNSSIAGGVDESGTDKEQKQYEMERENLRILAQIPRMGMEMNDIEDCPLHRAYLQLLFYIITLNQHYIEDPNEYIEKGYVIRVCPKGQSAESYALPRKFFEAAQRFYDSLFNYQLACGATKQNPSEYKNYKIMLEAMEKTHRKEQKQKKENKYMNLGGIS